MSDAVAEEDRIAALLDRATLKLLYKPFTVIAGVVGGMLASKLFARIWRALAGEDDAPGTTDYAKSWADILPAAALHGVVFGVVKAIVDRAGAEGFARWTGRWPGTRPPVDGLSADAQLGSAAPAPSPSTTKIPLPMLSKPRDSIGRLIEPPIKIIRREHKQQERMLRSLHAPARTRRPKP